jgi:murein DD-endopeptidase MepM/ murein hydrolase activator NlpD
MFPFRLKNAPDFDNFRKRAARLPGLALLIAGTLLACKKPDAVRIQAVALAERPAAPEQDADSAAEAADEAGWDLPILFVLQETPVPGEPVTVIYIPREGRIDQDFKAFLARPGGRPLARGTFFEYFKTPGGNLVSAALLAVPSTMNPGKALVYVESPAGIRGVRGITVAPRDFVSEEIFLNASNTAIRTEPDPQKTREAEQLWAIITRTGGNIHTEAPFAPPVSATRRTSFFGDRRVYKYSNGRSDTSIHAGIDYGIPAGTPVRSCAPGRVTLALFRIVTGNTVIIEHLPGVYSLYYHLDKILIEPGALTETGTLLGESGATGLATGPHLHWEIRVGAENTDPDITTSRPLLDKDLVMSKIKDWAYMEKPKNGRMPEGR